MFFQQNTTLFLDFIRVCSLVCFSINGKCRIILQFFAKINHDIYMLLNFHCSELDVHNGLLEETINVIKLTLMVSPKKHSWFFPKWKKVKTHACVLGFFPVDIANFLVISPQIHYIEVFDLTNPRFNEQIWSVPSDFVKLRFHCTLLKNQRAIK